MKFDPNQNKVIEAPIRPLLVTAGPGSGKTAVLTRRITYINEKYKIPFEKILVITFTKAAAASMKSRFEKENDVSSTSTFCTFHAFFYSIIKDSNKNFQIISLKEKMNILKTVLLDNDEDLSSFGIQTFLDEISKIKNLGFEDEDFEPVSTTKDKFYKYYKEYSNELNSEGYIDYDDFADLVLYLFSKDKMLFDKWSKKYTYCLIDEFQDINQKQYDVIKLLFKDKGVFAVGDEDQSIYAFRGSSSDICIKFRNDFDADVLKLETNYRSTRKIVEASRKLIEFNTLRFDKKIIPSEDAKEGLFKIRGFGTVNEEYEGICKDVKNAMDNYNSVAILLRTNNIPDSLVYYLLKEKIKFNTENTLKLDKENEHIDDILTYFKIADGDMTYKNLLKICNKPNRYISRNFLAECRANEKNRDGTFSFVNLYKTGKDKPYLIKHIFKLERNIRDLSKLGSLEGLIYVFNVIGYDSYLLSKNKSFKTEYEELKALSTQLPYKNELIEYFEYLKDFENGDKDDIAEKFSNESKTIKLLDKEKEVEICTVHASKGREWDAVFILDVNENSFPHKKAMSFKEIEEERRLFYVAMTRAKESLTISYVNDGEFLRPSLFIKELNE